MAKSSVPEGAVFEADLGNDEWGNGWALYDVSDILPVNKKRGGYPTRLEGVGTKPKYSKKKALTAADMVIVRVYNHHSGAKGKDGFAGLEASVKYSIRDKKRTKTIKSGPNEGEIREYIEKGWPGGPYTFWLCVKADRDTVGRKVIYRVNKDELRTYHTGNQANDHGLGVAWQGNLTTAKPSKDQLGGASVLFPHLHVTHPLSDHKPFSYHSESKEFGGSGKPTCPGPHVEAFVDDYRSRLTTVFFKDDDAPPIGVVKPVVHPPAVARAPRTPPRRNRHPLRRG
jgi:hypothetical protein